ncbi:MAG: hypothetical protein AAGA43_15385 [Bacteroidota bacterium]
MIQKVKKYKIFASDSPVILEQIVNNNLADGWHPIGGVSHFESDGDLFCQAAVMYEKDRL